MENRINLKCVIHGDYQKLISDHDMKCPHCLKTDAIAQKEDFIVKHALVETLKVVNVKISCDEHGVSEFEVPSFMKNRATRCPLCVQAKRAEKLKPKIEKIVAQSIKESGIPVNYIDQKFSNLDVEKSPKQQKIIERLIAYVKDLKLKGSSVGAKNILLSGNMGTGKTLIASILLQEVLKRSQVDGIQDERDIQLKSGLSVLFVSEPTLLNEITATWKSNTESSKGLINHLSSKSILCIDDVGAVTTTHAHLLDFYANLIDERYKRRLPTIMTSNLLHGDLRLAIGARSADRFMEKNRIIIANFDWCGYRSAQAGTDEIEIF